MTGYQQGILLANGTNAGGRVAVRHTDRFYPDVVQPLFGTKVYFQPRNQLPKKPDLWTVKGASVTIPNLEDIADHPGFCRAWIELKCSIKLATRKHRYLGRYYRPMLAIYGPEEIIHFIAEGIPAKPKKMQDIRTNNGRTTAFVYQSLEEILQILDYIDGTPKHKPTWDRWASIVTGQANDEDHPWYPDGRVHP